MEGSEDFLRFHDSVLHYLRMKGHEGDALEVRKLSKKFSGSFEDKLGGEALSFAEVEEMRANSNDGVYLIDVRSKAERDVSMVTGAISQDDFEKLHLQPGEKKGVKIIAYCTIGYRSGTYACQLADKGWTAYNGKGVVPWSWEEGPLLVKDGQPTKQVHVYGSTWEKAGPGYEAVKFSIFHQITTFLFGG